MTDKLKTYKSRMLFILRYLMRHTSDQKMLPIADIRSICEENGYGMPARNTVTNHLKTLIEAGFDIEYETINKVNYYYYAGYLTSSELKVLVDAADAAQFLTEDDTKALIDKLMSLSSSADDLGAAFGLSGTAKTEHKGLKYEIDTLRRMVRDKVSISFQYYDYNVQGEKVLHNDGEVYTMSPYGLHCDNNRYYLIGFLDKRQDINHFRVDLIRSVHASGQDFVEPTESFDMAGYCSKVFGMYSGNVVDVVIEAPNRLMKKFVDRFGINFESWPVSDEHFRAKATVSVSPTFFGWVFEYNGDMTIVEPVGVKQQYEEMLERILKQSNLNFQ